MNCYSKKEPNVASGFRELIHVSLVVDIKRFWRDTIHWDHVKIVSTGLTDCITVTQSEGIIAHKLM